VPCGGIIYERYTRRDTSIHREFIAFCFYREPSEDQAIPQERRDGDRKEPLALYLERGVP